MIAPAIHYPGNCAEAIALYQTVFPVADVHVDYYRDAPSDPGFPVTEENKDMVMHAELTICGSRVNMSDSGDAVVAGNMIVLNVFLDSPDAVSHAFHGLKKGGKVIVELGPQFFSPMYASVEDRFGVRWQLIS